jgi:hypothetical protein
MRPEVESELKSFAIAIVDVDVVVVVVISVVNKRKKVVKIYEKEGILHGIMTK